MNKEEFLAALRVRLAVFPEKEIEKHVNYYREMIEDHVEDGYPEEKVIETLGSVDRIVSVILEEVALSHLLKQKVRSQRRKLKKWERTLLICTSPVWVPVAIALAATAGALLLTLYILLWTLILVLWTLEIFLAACGLGTAFLGVLQLFVEFNGFVVGTFLAGALVCTGLTLLLFHPCILATKGMARLSRKIWLGIKFMIIGKEKRI
jgi:uncharacterized membrane protein